MNGLNHFKATSLGTSPLNLLWELNLSFSLWNSQEPSSARLTGIYPLHLTEDLVSLGN